MLEPSRGGFVKQGKSEAVEERVDHPLPVVPPRLFPDEDAFGDADPRGLEDPLLDVLVHAEGRGEDAGSRVGNPEELQETLHAAVLPEFPVEGDEGEIDLLLEPLVGDPPRLFFETLGDVRRRVLGDELPGDDPEPSLAVHEDRHGIVGLPVEVVDTRSCRC